MSIYDNDPDLPQNHCECDECDICLGVEPKVSMVLRPVGVAPDDVNEFVDTRRGDFKASWEQDGEYCTTLCAGSEAMAEEHAMNAARNGHLNAGVDQYIPGNGWQRITTVAEEVRDEQAELKDILGPTARELAESLSIDVNYAMRQLREFQDVGRAIDALERVQEALKDVLEQ